MSNNNNNNNNIIKYDLTKYIIPYLDPHIALQLIYFLSEKNLYKTNNLKSVMLNILNGTKMFDSSIEEYRSLYGKDAPEEMLKARDEAVKGLEEGVNIINPLYEVLKDANLVEELRHENLFTLEYLKENYSVTEEILEATFDYAKLNYDCGRYVDARDLLFYYRLLSKDEEKCFRALWGKLAAEMLTGGWEVAISDLRTLQELIDNRTSVSHTEQLQQRTWLLHWSVFIFFNYDGNNNNNDNNDDENKNIDGRSKMADFILSNQRLMNTLQTTCVYLLRYFAFAVVCDSRRRNYFKHFLSVLREEAIDDPVTNFILKVCVEFDFAAAREQLEEVEKMLEIDFFCASFKDEFMTNARILMFETIAKTHKYIRIETLMKYLDLSPDDDKSERIIVDYIRKSRIDAKIDTEGYQLVIGQNYPSIFQQVIDKTKPYSHSSTQLFNQLEKRILSMTADN